MLTAAAIARALETIAEFIDAQRPRGDKAERTTFRQFADEVEARLREIGVTPQMIEAYRDDDAVRDASESFGMALDDNSLIPEFEHQWDLPIAFRRMPEYGPMLDAERELWRAIGDQSEPTREQWAALMKETAPWVKAMSADD